MTTPAQRDAQTHAPTCTRSRAFGAASFLAGLVFGLGLVLAGMTDPRKVLGFLDLAGAWDPSLAFVLGGAVGFSAVAFRVALRRARPWFADVFRLPSRTDFDAALVIGAAVFGIAAKVGDKHAVSREVPRSARNDDLADGKLAGDGGGVQGSGAAIGDQGKVRGIEPALGRHARHHVRHGRGGDADDAAGGDPDADADDDSSPAGDSDADSEAYRGADLPKDDEGKALRKKVLAMDKRRMG